MQRPWGRTLLGSWKRDKEARVAGAQRAGGEDGRDGQIVVEAGLSNFPGCLRTLTWTAHELGVF